MSHLHWHGGSFEPALPGYDFADVIDHLRATVGAPFADAAMAAAEGCSRRTLCTNGPAGLGRGTCRCIANRMVILTRRTIHRILRDCERLDDFKRSPQQFIETVATAINQAKRPAVVDGIKYQRLGDEHYYAQVLFQTEELTGYLKNMAPSARKCVYETVVYDLDVERDFVERMGKTPRSRSTQSSLVGSRCLPRSEVTTQIGRR